MTNTGEWTTRRYLSLLGNILIWVIVVIDGFYLWPTALHGSTSMVIVSGHSMEPTYFTGDLVIARKMEPSVGDVIVYAPDGFGGSQIVHRIVGGNAQDGWVMQGDNNPNADPFTPKGKEIKGVVLVHYANFGRVTVLLLNPIVWALVLLAAVVLLVWWSGDTCEDDPEDKDKDKDKREDGGDPESEAEEEPDLIDRIVEGTEAAVSRMVASSADAGAAALAVLTRPSPAPRHAARAPRYRAPALLRGSAIVAVLGLLAIYGPSSASASSLTINTGGNIFTHTYTPCTTTALTATATGGHNGQNYTHVTISGIGADCAGLPIVVNVYANNGDASGSAPAATVGSQEIATSGFNQNQVSAVVVKINGWPFVATWGGVAPAMSCVGADASGQPTGQPCTVSQRSGSSWPAAGAGNKQGNLYFFGTTDAPYVILTIDVDAAIGMVPVVVNLVDTTPVMVLAPGYMCSSLPVIRLKVKVQNYNNGSTFWGGLAFYTNPSEATGTSLCH